MTQASGIHSALFKGIVADGYSASLALRLGILPAARNLHPGISQRQKEEQLTVMILIG